MAFFIKAPNIAVAWLSAMRYLWDEGGTAVNLFVVAEQGDEDQRLRRCLDTFLVGAQVKHKDVLPVETVANTIFPGNLYQVAPKSCLNYTPKLGRCGNALRRRKNTSTGLYPGGDRMDR